MLTGEGSYDNIAKHGTIHTQSDVPCPHCSYVAKELINLFFTYFFLYLMKLCKVDLER